MRALLEKGRTVRAVYNSDRRALEGLPCEQVRADLLDPESLRRAFDGAEVVHHFAAMVSIAGDPTGAVWRTNVDGVRCVLEAAQAVGVRRVVHCSSVHAFDLHSLQGAVTERTPSALGPHCGAYERSKAAGENEVRKAVARGLDAVILNPTGVTGPFDFKPSRFGRFLLDVAQRRLPALVSGGMDHVDVRDVAEAAISAETRGRAGQAHLLGGQYYSVTEVAGLMARAAGVSPPLFAAPLGLAKVFAPAVLGASQLLRVDPLFTPEALWALGLELQVDHSLASRELGFDPRPLAQTLEDTLRWFRDAGMLTR